MNGVLRPLARYASPHSRMKRVGEIVSRPVFGLSTPRGASAPPHTRTSALASLSASYVCASSRRYAGADAPAPLSANWGIQKRLRFGSLPTITSRNAGFAATIAADRLPDNLRGGSEGGAIP